MLRFSSPSEEIKFFQALFNHLPLDYQKKLWLNQAVQRLSDRERNLISYPLPDGPSDLYRKLCDWSTDVG